MALSQSKPGSPALRNARDYRPLLANIFRQRGWRVKQQSKGAALSISRGSQRFLVELKAASEGRPDRLIPLLSQAILQARAFAQASPDSVVPIAVVAAPVILPKAADSLVRFLAEFAPEAAAGIFDREGFQRFVGPGLEDLNAAPPRQAGKKKLAPPESAYLFSDLNQWMLKVLLARFLPEELLRAPRQEYRNASDLAAAAGVSVMSAFRMVRQLRQEGFLESDDAPLRLVRRGELLHRWKAAHLRSVPARPLRWIIPRKEARPILAALKIYSQRADDKIASAPRACLGLFAAAESLGFGFVHGVPPSFYLENLDREILSGMGLSPEGAEHKPDVYVRVPIYREAVFRAAVMRDGVPISDILQVWLDVSSHPARGEAQAEEIRRRALAPIFEE